MIAGLRSPVHTVDIRGDAAAWLLIIVTFIVTVAVVCAIGFIVVVSKRIRQAQGGPAAVRLTFASRLPVSKPVFDSIESTAAAVMSRPQIAPATRTRIEKLASKRRIYVRFYRVGMIIAGLIGLTAATTLFRSHTPANMLGLPAAIILLLALGALLSGLIPGPSLVPVVEPIDPRLLDRIKVHVSKSGDPLTVSLSDSDLQRAADLLRRGVPIATVARAVYPGYDRLDQFDQQAFGSTLSQLTKKVTE